MMPVCGDDGFDYPSECEMRRQACIEMRNVAKKYDGKCGEFCFFILNLVLNGTVS